MALKSKADGLFMEAQRGQIIENKFLFKMISTLPVEIAKLYRPPGSLRASLPIHLATNRSLRTGTEQGNPTV